MEVKDFYKMYEKNTKLFVQTVGQGAGEQQGSGKQPRKHWITICRQNTWNSTNVHPARKMKETA